MRRHNVHRVRKSAAASPVKPLPWRSVLLTLICACILAAGFFYAARQHFSTIDLGLKNSKLRKQIEDLESERRRLVLAREVSLSPVEKNSLSPVEKKRMARDLPLKEEPEAEPQVQETARVEKPELTKASPKPVQISMPEAKKSAVSEPKPAEVKKVVKPRSEQTAQKSPSPNERPRVVAENEKRVASASVKSF
jgi:hypothetical protein